MFEERKHGSDTGSKPEPQPSSGGNNDFENASTTNKDSRPAIADLSGKQSQN